MIAMDYKGLRDRHLNIFCGYDTEHLENNITKALINTFDSFDVSTKKQICEFFIQCKIPFDIVSTRLFLQKQPDKAIIKGVPLSNRFLIAFSPTGIAWGFRGQDIQDERVLRSEIIKEWKKEHSDASSEETERVVIKAIEEIKGRKKESGSIPDGWIVVYCDDSPHYIIAFENKKTNLDPDQINNHLEKSLLIFESEDKKRATKYYNYETIAESFRKTNTFLGFQFVEYLTILGYLSIDSLPLACSADAEIRTLLMERPCKNVMERVFNGKIDKRNATTVRKILNKSYFLREINLCYGDRESDRIYISLALGPTARTAQKMYSEITLPLVFHSPLIKGPFISFHLQFRAGRNIRSSYYDEDPQWPIKDYLEFWKKHVADVKTMSTFDAASFIEEHKKELHFTDAKANELASYLRARRNPVCIVPELIYEIVWPCKEVAKMKDNEEFEEELKAALKEFFDAICFHLEGIN